MKYPSKIIFVLLTPDVAVHTSVVVVENTIAERFCRIRYISDLQRPCHRFATDMGRIEPAGKDSCWTIFEKESYAIFASTIRISHNLVGFEDSSLFTDHKNLLYMLSTSRFNENVARHVLSKIQSWTLRLAESNFVIEKIPRESNVWMNLLTCCAAPDYDSSSARRICAIKVPFLTEENLSVPHSMSLLKYRGGRKNPILRKEFRIGPSNMLCAVFCMPSSKLSSTKIQIHHDLQLARNVQQLPGSLRRVVWCCFPAVVTDCGPHP